MMRKIKKITDFFRKRFLSSDSIDSTIKHFREGLTLIELIIVIAILGLLAVGLMTILNPFEQIKKSNDSNRKASLVQIQKGLENYYNDNGRYPASSSNYKIFDGSKEITPNSQWDDYFKKFPADPTGKNYAYYSPDGQSYYLYASLDRKNDPQACSKTGTCSSITAAGLPANICGGTCNFGVSSPNVSVNDAVAIPTAAPIPPTSSQPTQTPIPTSTPAPTVPPVWTSTPIPPTPTRTPTPVPPTPTRTPTPVPPTPTFVLPTTAPTMVPPTPTRTPTPVPPTPTRTPTPVPPTNTPVPPTPTPTGSVIKIYAAGETADGTYPNMQLLINDVVMQAWTNIRGDYSTRTFQTYTFNSPTKVFANQIKIQFNNDASGRNLIVDKINVDGVDDQTEATDTYSYFPDGGCTNGYLQQEIIHCNGYFQYMRRPITLVQSREAHVCDGGPSSVSVSLSSVGTGHLIVAAVSTWMSGTITVSDNMSNTYSLAVAQPTSSGNRVAIYYAQNVTGGSLTITARNSAGGSPNITLAAYEYSGAATSNVLDKTMSTLASSASTTANSGNTAATTQANELVFGASTFSETLTISSITAGSGFTLRTSQRDNNSCQALATEDKMVYATGAYNATFTASSGVTFRTAVATFKAGSVAGISTGPRDPEPISNKCDLGEKIVDQLTDISHYPVAIGLINLRQAYGLPYLLTKILLSCN